MKIEFKFDFGQEVWWLKDGEYKRGMVYSVTAREHFPPTYQVVGYEGAANAEYVRERALFPTVKELRKTELEGLISKLGRQLAEAEMELAKLKEEEK